MALKAAMYWVRDPSGGWTALNVNVSQSHYNIFRKDTDVISLRTKGFFVTMVKHVFSHFSSVQMSLQTSSAQNGIERVIDLEARSGFAAAASFLSSSTTITINLLGKLAVTVATQRRYNRAKQQQKDMFTTVKSSSRTSKKSGNQMPC